MSLSLSKSFSIPLSAIRNDPIDHGYQHQKEKKLFQ